MQQNDLYFKYSKYLKEKYGHKVYKIPVSIPVSCPVRDGSISYKGCIYCGQNATGYESHDPQIAIEEQIRHNIEYISKKCGADHFDIYFQNFTNTFLPLSDFESYIRQALLTDDHIQRVTISTRPDCIAKEYLDILSKLSLFFHVDITIELGLQSINPITLKKLNRGHSLAEYIGAMNLINSYGFETCTHLITTLPWDRDDDIIEAAKIISTLQGTSVKLHNLYIEKDTPLEKMYKDKEFEMLSLDVYIKRTADFIEYLNPKISLQRLNARVPKEVSVFSNWGKSHWVLTDLIVEELTKRGSYQGINFHYGTDSQVKKFISGASNGC